jgi:hypothetical protein
MGTSLTPQELERRKVIVESSRSYRDASIRIHGYPGKASVIKKFANELGWLGPNASPGPPSKFSYDSLTAIVDSVESTTWADVVRVAYGETGNSSKHRHLKQRASMLGVDISRFSLTPPAPKWRSNGRVLRNALLRAGVPEKCSVCDISEWCGSPLRVQVDHISGDSHDNRVENLRFLCPNCHSQTATFSNKKR